MMFCIICGISKGIYSSCSSRKDLCGTELCIILFYFLCCVYSIAKQIPDIFENIASIVI